MFEGIEIQGHRGARARVPENTMIAFELAHRLGVDVVELDVVAAKDGILVSHEPWMSPEICSHPDGTPVSSKPEEAPTIFSMTLEEAQTYDCGLRGNPRFPDQAAQAAHKPRLSEVLEWADDLVARGAFVKLNIEIKSKPAWVNAGLQPEPEELVRRVMAEMGDRDAWITIQSFDPAVLRVLHQAFPAYKLVYLTKTVTPNEVEKELGFIPAIYSPKSALVTPSIVADAHALGMRVVVWTVNELDEAKRLSDAKVDGIITDDPELLLSERNK